MKFAINNDISTPVSDVAPLINDPVRGNSDSIQQPQMSAMMLASVSAGLFGLQLSWSVEYSYGTPSLLAIGLPNTATSLVWLAGPISGLITQPLVGVISDHSLRRRVAFIVGGIVFVALGFALLSYSCKNASLVGDSHANRFFVFTAAVLGFYILDFALNAAQSASRALVLDVAPLYQLDSANAYASMMSNIGGVCGYLLTVLDLQGLFEHLGIIDKRESQTTDNAPSAQNGMVDQLPILSAFTCIVLTVTVAVTVGTAALIYQRKIITSSPDESVRTSHENTLSRGLIPLMLQVKTAHDTLSPNLKTILRTQFFAWLGWFPVLIYASTYVAQFATNSYSPFNTAAPGDSTAVRSGCFAFLWFSISGLIASLILPRVMSSIWLKRAISKYCKVHKDVHSESSDFSNAGLRRAAALPFSLTDERAFEEEQFPEDNMERIRSCEKDEEEEEEEEDSILYTAWSLARLWQLSCLFFALIALSTMFISSRTGVTIVVLLLGICWSVSIWVPHTLLAIFNTSVAHNVSRIQYSQVSGTQRDEHVEFEPNNACEIIGNGILLGINNIYVVLPQFIVSAVAALVFMYAPTAPADAEMESGSRFDTIGWLFRTGGLCAIIAAYQLHKLEFSSLLLSR